MASGKKGRKWKIKKEKIENFIQALRKGEDKVKNKRNKDFKELRFLKAMEKGEELAKGKLLEQKMNPNILRERVREEEKRISNKMEKSEGKEQERLKKKLEKLKEIEQEVTQIIEDIKEEKKEKEEELEKKMEEFRESPESKKEIDIMKRGSKEREQELEEQQEGVRETTRGIVKEKLSRGKSVEEVREDLSEEKILFGEKGIEEIITEGIEQYASRIHDTIGEKSKVRNILDKKGVNKDKIDEIMDKI